MDLAPLWGTNYYRLRQVDFGGEEAFSGVASIEWYEGDENGQIILSPNPAQDWFSVRFNFPEEPESFRILNATGQEVLAGTWPRNNQITISELPNGVYFLEVYGERFGVNWVNWMKH